jgi:hypothetical protein
MREETILVSFRATFCEEETIPAIEVSPSSSTVGDDSVSAVT